MVMITHLNMVLYSCERQMHTGRRVPRRWWQQIAEKPEIMLLDRAAVTKTAARPLLDQDCRDENCRQDRHAIVIMLNTYLHIYNT
mmetsp:Transcript_75399/g.214436  ORF Transcript_75399/g.214436 Transcript_75399/m.214436 type:complete len:85 (+) Transcript_75399:335-589(+)